MFQLSARDTFLHQLLVMCYSQGKTNSVRMLSTILSKMALMKFSVTAMLSTGATSAPLSALTTEKRALVRTPSSPQCSAGLLGRTAPREEPVCRSAAGLVAY